MKGYVAFLAEALNSVPRKTLHPDHFFFIITEMVKDDVKEGHIPILGSIRHPKST